MNKAKHENKLEIESGSFYFRKYKVMTPFSKDPITCDYIRYQNDLISVAETIGSPKKSANSI